MHVHVECIEASKRLRAEVLVHELSKPLQSAARWQTEIGSYRLKDRRHGNRKEPRASSRSHRIRRRGSRAQDEEHAQRSVSEEKVRISGSSSRELCCRISSHAHILEQCLVESRCSFSRACGKRKHVRRGCTSYGRTLAKSSEPPYLRQKRASMCFEAEFAQPEHL